MARVVHLHLDAVPIGPALVRLGMHGRAFAAVLGAAAAVLHHRFTTPELQRLDYRLLQDPELRGEDQAGWQHLDALTPQERGRIDWPHY